jgi:Recombination endonuclease VII
MKELNEIQKLRKAERGRVWRKANAERLAEVKKKWREDNKERNYENNNAWRQAHPEIIRASKQRSSMRKIGIDPSALPPYPSDNRCPVCKRAAKGKAIGFDHCHRCGAFRNWMCGRCNTILGLAEDDVATLKLLTLILEQHKC